MSELLDAMHKLSLQDGDLLFVDIDCVNLQSLTRCGIKKDVRIIPIVVPEGQTVAECVSLLTKAELASKLA